VVVRQAIDHPVGAVGQRDETGRREDARLTHPTADHLPGPPSPSDERSIADDDRPDRAAERLRQAERDRIGGVREVASCDPVIPLRDDGVPEASAVDMERHPVPPSDRGDLALVRRRQRSGHRMGMCVLEGHQAGERLVRVVRVAERLLDRAEIERAVRSVFECPGARADDHRVTGCLVDDEVVRLPGDDLLAAAEVGHQGHEIAHGAGGDEEARLLAEEVGGTLLELVDGRVVAEHVVAELGRRHGPAHRLGRAGDGVAAEVDRALGHGPRV
jgi:hypothetical protein